MPYALATGHGRLLAGLASGEIWESRDDGESWTALALGGEPLGALQALAFAA